MHHSDRGSPYTSGDLQDLLEKEGITCSVSRAGAVSSNSAMDRFFGLMKSERVPCKVYRTREQPKSDVFDIERF